MKFLLLILLIANTLFATNESFSHSKKELRKIYRDHQRTIYCDCKYNYKNKKNMIDKRSCGYIPRNKYTKKGKLNIRANRIEWEHAQSLRKISEGSSLAGEMEMLNVLLLRISTIKVVSAAQRSTNSIESCKQICTISFLV